MNNYLNCDYDRALILIKGSEGSLSLIQLLLECHPLLYLQDRTKDMYMHPARLFLFHDDFSVTINLITVSAISAMYCDRNTLYLYEDCEK